MSEIENTEGIEIPEGALMYVGAKKVIDPNKKVIKEEDGLHKQWYEEADKCTIEELGTFVKKLVTDYEHDYGSIIHAIAAAVGATITAMNNSDQGGITGFQAGCLMWEILQKQFHIEWPSALLRYEKMLFPQYENRFTSITPEVWQWMREQAAERLKNEPDAAASVKHHWTKITQGIVPFGYKIKDDA